MQVRVRFGNPGFTAVVVIALVLGFIVGLDALLGRLVPDHEPILEALSDGTLRTPWIAAAGVASAPWLLVMGVIRLIRQPRQPRPAAATQDLPPEPPAVANMLADDFEPTREALPATVIDLAARRIIDIEEAGHRQYRVRLRGRPDPSLAPFERRVLDLLRSRAADGVVPTGALTTGPAERARRWWKGFRGEVIDEAQRRGLSRDVWDGPTLAAVTLLALPAAPLWWIAFREWAPALVYVFLVGAVVGAAKDGQRQRHTPLGLETAARWLGVRRFHRQGAFDDLPPTAVVVWERHLAYAAALGVARDAIRAIPMGADEDRRAWSAYGGEWRLVRVRYPVLWPPAWGRAPWYALFIGALQVFVSVFAVYGFSRLWQEIEGELPPGGVGPTRIAYVVLATGFGLFGFRALLQSAFAAADLGKSQDWTGLILRVRSFGGSRDSPPRRYVAIDDGKTDDVRAFRIHPKLWTTTGFTEYREATFTVSPRLGYVRAVRSATSPSPPPPRPHPRRRNSSSGS